MKKGKIAGGGALALTLMLVGTHGFAAAPEHNLKERGMYLTHDVAMCVQCHTPRLSDGSLDRTRPFTGAPVPVAAPSFPDQQWALRAPAIGGPARLTEQDMMSVLMTGRRVSGGSPKPPMPPFRLAREDARAIVEYLRSVTP